MKKIALLFTLFLPLSLMTLKAQHNSFFIGANGGVNLSKFKFTEDLKELYPSSNKLLGLNGGVELGFEIQNFTISTGVQYSQKGSEYQTDNFEDENGIGYYSAKEKLHFVSIPILFGYRKYFGEKIGLTFAFGPSINFGVGGKIDDQIEYFGSDQIETQNYKVLFGEGVNDDYKSTQMGFQVSPGLIFNVNNKSKLKFNVTWDFGSSDSFNPRYKNANDFFADNKGDQLNRTTMFSIGYEYHFSFGDKY